uniref:Sugar transporter SWEET1 n=1 Tax=Peronospora matthiolae TaxID=2874970 RepID=A0AAV1TTC5_9STRA
MSMESVANAAYMTYFLAAKAVPVVATCASVLFALAPWPTVAAIRRARSTLQFPFAPFFFYFVQSIIYTLYGWTTANLVVGGTSLLGVLLGAYYVLIYYKYTPNRTQPTRLLSSAMLVILLMVYQVFTRSPEETQLITGIPANILSVFTAASPLLQLKSILRRKDASCLPLGMSAMNVVGGSLWFIYGIMLGDPLVMCPNLFSLTMGIIQVSLICLYPGGKINSAEEIKAEAIKPGKKVSPRNKTKVHRPE